MYMMLASIGCPVVAALEGGYDLECTAEGAHAVVEAMLVRPNKDAFPQYKLIEFFRRLKKLLS